MLNFNQFSLIRHYGEKRLKIGGFSVGFTIAEYEFPMAFICSLIIGVVTFFISIGGVEIGKAFGTKLSTHAQILGGSILIFIGLKIFFGF